MPHKRRCSFPDWFYDEIPPCGKWPSYDWHVIPGDRITVGGVFPPLMDLEPAIVSVLKTPSNLEKYHDNCWVERVNFHGIEFEFWCMPLNFRVVCYECGIYASSHEDLRGEPLASLITNITDVCEQIIIRHVHAA